MRCKGYSYVYPHDVDIKLHSTLTGSVIYEYKVYLHKVYKDAFNMDLLCNDINKRYIYLTMMSKDKHN